MERFTAHNIELPGGKRTIPKHSLLADTPLVRSVLRTLHVAFGGDLAGKTIVDLGCLEGGWTVEFARAGLDALGIEVRKLNMEKCDYVSERLGLPNLRFVQDDARNIGRHGTFDAVFCSGLLYHLDEPAAYLRDLAAATRRVLILCTHHAPAFDTWFEDPSVPTAVEGFELSQIETHEGNLGRWYGEYEEDDDQEEVESLVQAAYGNYRSFWMLKRHLLQELRNVGFSPVYEQFDWHENLVTGDYMELESWGIFVGYRDVPPLEPPPD
jgi:SAM-dependent methyltransferase